MGDVGQIELIFDASKGWSDSCSDARQVIGNMMWFGIIRIRDKLEYQDKHHSQLKECQVRIAVVSLLFALLGYIFLKYSGSSRIVTV